MKDLGPANSILGINIERDGPPGSIKLLQCQYIRSLLTKFNMSDAKPVATPLDSNVKLSKDEYPYGRRKNKCVIYRIENS